MQELSTPLPPSVNDLPDLLAAAHAALSAAATRRAEIESAIRKTDSIQDLDRLRSQWDEVIHQQEAAAMRCRELEQLLANNN